MTYRRGGDGTYGAYANQDDIRPATATHQGLMSRADKAKLDNLGAVRLTYLATTDIANGLAVTLNTWTTIGTAQGFNVGLTTSAILVSVAGSIIAGAAGLISVGSRVLFDGTTPGNLGGWPSVAAGAFGNALAGAAPRVFSGFAAGAHTVAVQIIVSANATAYCRAASNPNYEGLTIGVVELAV
jgi:hypothetical protein